MIGFPVFRIGEPIISRIRRDTVVSFDPKANLKTGGSRNRQIRMGIPNQEVVRTLKEGGAAMGFASDISPEGESLWMCTSCGRTWKNGQFCAECGTPKPKGFEGWKCTCGHRGRGNFCSACGSARPAGVCDRCGWKPEDDASMQKFCPECGSVIRNEKVEDTKVPEYYWG